MSLDRKRQNEAPAVRLDKWLWAARFFKTRSLAQQAIEGGRVEVNGQRSKASHRVTVGEELRISIPRGEYTILVKGLSEQRGPASQAAMLYEERDESRLRREALIEQKKFAGSVAPDIRPSTQDRHRLRRIKETGGFEP